MRSSWRLTALIVLAGFLLPAPSAWAFVLPPASLEAAAAARRDGTCAGHLESLRARAAESNPAGARAGYLLAHCLDALGRASEAYTMFIETAERYPPVAAYARYHAARVALALGRPHDTLAALERVVDKTDPRHFSQRLRLLRADALVRIARYSDAIRILRPLLRERTLDDAVIVEGWWLLGVAADHSGDHRQAIHAYGMTWWAVPRNPRAAPAVRRLRELNNGKVPSPPDDARIMRGFRLLRTGQPDLAEQELLAGLRGRPEPDRAADGWHQVGLLRGGGRRAVSAFREAARYAHQAPRAHYWLGRSLLAAGRGTEGRAVLRRVESRFSTTPWAPRALLVLARSAEGSRADTMLLELIRRYPTSASADEARWRRGWLRYQHGRFAEAEAIFRDAATRHPAMPKAAANLYWSAKAKAARGQSARAELMQTAHRYALTFYGQRANARLGRVPPKPSTPPAPARLSETEFGPAFAELDALGFESEAAEIVEADAERSGNRELFIAASAIRLEAGQVNEAVQTSEPAIGPALYGGMPADARVWMLAYPRAYWDAVQSAARNTNVDPYLLLAVIREESRYDPQAFSIAGAVGLMQLLPGTAEGLAGARMSIAQLMQPEINVRLGAAYLGGLIRRFNGDVVLAVAGYNAGPFAAQRFGRMARTDPDIFFERIPYVETRAYVQRVLQTYGIYQWLYR